MADREQTALALAQLDELLGRAPTELLDVGACATLVSLSAAVPGRRARVVEALRRQRDSAALDALLRLPSRTPGVVEAVFAGLRHGVARPRSDGSAFPCMLALEFRSSKSRRFPALIDRATAAFGARLERLRVADVLHYRFAMFEHADLPASIRPLALDIESIHRDLLRLRGVRLWLNGWCFDDDSTLRPAIRVPLLRGWLDWATSGELPGSGGC
ncbi:MAG: hypothetical protein R6X02_08810 [Enhygromyxa sp.]